MLRTSSLVGYARSGSTISCGFFERSFYVITFYVEFMLVFLMFLWLCPFFKNQIVFGMGLSCAFFVFYYFFLRLYNSLQKNKLSSFKLGKSGLGTVGFLFLVMLLFYDLWCLVSCVGWFGLVYNSFPTG